MICLLAVAWVSAAKAQQTNLISLASAKQAAVERNWDLLAAKANMDLATAQLLVVKEFPNPSLSISTSKIGDRQNSTPDGNGLWARSYDTIFAVNQLIEIGGKRKDRQASARASILSAKARFLDAKRLLEQGVTKAFVAALLADENERILRQSAGFMKKEDDLAEVRFKAGDISESDLKQIQVSVDQFNLQANAAAAAAVQARIAVEILLGNPQPKGLWRTEDTLASIEAKEKQESIRPVDGLRPDVLATEMDLKAARENLKLQRAIRIPDPTFTAQYEHQPPGGGPPADTVGFGISIPLPIWNANKGNIDSAKASLEQATLALAKIKAQAEGDIVSAMSANREAVERLKRYREQIAPNSASVRESVKYKFEKGAATLVDLLEAQRTDNDVRIATAQAMADSISTSADLAASQEAARETELNRIP